MSDPRDVCCWPVQRATLATFGAVLAAGATACLAVATARYTPGRLAFYALLCAARLPRATLLGTIGVAAAAPAAMADRSRAARVTCAVNLAAVTLSAFISTALYRTAQAHGIRLSLRTALFGARQHESIQSQEVTFARGVDWRLKADLYWARNAAARRPAVVVIHGGAWRYGDKGENLAFNRWLAARGFVVFDIQYRLAGSATWREAVDDICAAMRWLRSQHPALNIDPRRVALLGRSAGGHLALLTAYTSAEATRPWRVIAFYAPTDLARYVDECRGRHRAELRAAVELLADGTSSSGPAAYDALSVLRHMHADAPPTLLIHGQWDTGVPVRHSERLAARAHRAGAHVELIKVPFARHVFDLIPGGLATQLAAAAVLRFLQSSSLPA